MNVKKLFIISVIQLSILTGVVYLLYNYQWAKIAALVIMCIGAMMFQTLLWMPIGRVKPKDKINRVTHNWGTNER